MLQYRRRPSRHPCAEQQQGHHDVQQKPRTRSERVCNPLNIAVPRTSTMLPNGGNITTTLMTTQSEHHMRYIRLNSRRTRPKYCHLQRNAAIDYAPSRVIASSVMTILFLMRSRIFATLAGREAGMPSWRCRARWVFCMTARVCNIYIYIYTCPMASRADCD